MKILLPTILLALSACDKEPDPVYRTECYRGDQKPTAKVVSVDSETVLYIYCKWDECPRNPTSYAKGHGFKRSLTDFKELFPRQVNCPWKDTRHDE